MATVFDLPSDLITTPLGSAGDSSPARNMPALLLAMAGAINVVENAIGVAGGLATLDGTGHVPDAQIPSTITRDTELTAAINAVINAAPGALDTLDELAAALGDDAAFSVTMTNALAGKVSRSLFDANTILIATTDDTPAALTVGASTFVGRKSTGGIVAMTPTEAKTELAIAEADVTNLVSDLAAKVPKSLFDANTILIATSDDTPVALTVGASTFVGRKSAGGIVALTPAEAKTELAIAQSDVSGLTAALALLATDSLVTHLAGIETITGAKTFSTSPTLNNAVMLEMVGTSGNNARLGVSGTVLQMRTGSGGLQVLGNGAAEIFNITSAGVWTLAAGANIATNATTGTILATAVGQKLGFHGSTAVVQRAGAAQVAVATTAATNVGPYGFTTQAQADAIVTLVNELRAMAVEKGLMKGAA